MTVLLVIVDAHTYLLQASELPAPELARQIQNGDWSFGLSLPGQNVWLPETPRQVSAFDGLLIVTADLPQQAALGEMERAPRVRFSSQQVKILEALMDGLTAKEIAVRLNLSERALDEYTGEIKRKLEARTMAQTVGRAVAMGYWRPKKKN
jgi:DNA-binding CsgD family transcriptional regulator